MSLTPSARDIVAAFVADLSQGNHAEDPALAAILLEHLLLQGGFKMVPRQPNELIVLAGSRATAPDDIWREMWDAAGIYDPESENYTPA